MWTLAQCFLPIDSKVCNYRVLSYWIQNGSRSYVWVHGSANGSFRGLNSYLRSILTASVVAGRNPGLKSETWATHFLLCWGKLTFCSAGQAEVLLCLGCYRFCCQKASMAL